MGDQPVHANLEGGTFLEDIRTAPVDSPDAVEITEFGGWRAYLASKR